MNKAGGWLLCGLLALGALGCSSADEPAGAEVVFGTALICLGDSAEPLVVEVASTETQRQRGLMGRDGLAPDTGMLFRYPDEATPKYGFWMFNVPFALEVAFISAAGEVVDIKKMAPCVGVPARECPPYQTSHPYQSALEVSPGVLRAHGVVRGSVIRDAVNGVCDTD